MGNWKHPDPNVTEYRGSDPLYPLTGKEKEWLALWEREKDEEARSAWSTFHQDAWATAGPKR